MTNKEINIKIVAPEGIFCDSDEKNIHCQYWHKGKCRIFGELQNQYIGAEYGVEYLKNSACLGDK